MGRPALHWLERANQTKATINDLSGTYVIDGHETDGREFLFGKRWLEGLQDKTSTMLEAMKSAPLQGMSALKNNLQEDVQDIENNWENRSLIALSLNTPSQ